MLKHRYNSLSESVSDFNRMLDGMNKTQPLERSFEDDLSEMFNTEQELVRLEQNIEHVVKVISDSSVQISEEDANNIAKMHNHAASMYSQAAMKAKHRIEAAQRSGNSKMAAKMQEVHDRLRSMADDHAKKAKARIEHKVVAESVQKRTSSAMQTMRRLAGIDVEVQMPRDPGLFGTTRFNEGYDSMAKPFEESDCEPSAHNKKMKADAKKIKKAADDVEKAHGGSKEESKWASDAVKRPGRLHRYFGIPEGQKIPMSKIKAAYNKLKDKENKSAEETSLMRALALGVRFKGGDVPGGEKKKGLAGD